MKASFLIIFAILMVFEAYPQKLVLSPENLVLNPSLEECTKYPKNDLYFHYVTHWDNISGGTENPYYHRKGGISKGGYSFKVPNCAGAYQQPRTGDALAGMQVRSEDKKNYAVLQAMLKEPLIAGHEYYAEIFLNLSDKWYHTTSSFQICFSDTVFSYDPGMEYYYNLEPQVSNHPDSFITDVEGWTKVSGTFIAKGGEKYAAIGNLARRFAVKKVPVRTTNPRTDKVANRIDFFIDDFSVIDITEDINLKPGEAFVMKHVFFESGKYDLLPASYPELDKLTAYLKKNPKVKIEIAGHTDNTGSATSNRTLSQKRAEAAMNYLISKGINKNRLKHKGYGSSRPVDSNSMPEGRKNNRRVEVSIITE
jgi:outer membrane protein OmpA-like peptidoglycan-associated protein